MSKETYVYQKDLAKRPANEITYLISNCVQKKNKKTPSWFWTGLRYTKYVNRDLYTSKKTNIYQKRSATAPSWFRTGLSYINHVRRDLYLSKDNYERDLQTHIALRAEDKRYGTLLISSYTKYVKRHFDTTSNRLIYSKENYILIRELYISKETYIHQKTLWYYIK